MPFPLEIYDSVLDYLHSDKSALKACALAGRCLLQTCRYHLFSRITLPLTDVVVFLEFAEGSPNDLISLVHCLSVRGSPTLEGLIPKVPVTARTKELKILLRDLTSLRLSSFFWAALPADNQYLLSCLPSVTHLVLDRVSFETAQSLLVFICSFKALHTISFTNWAKQRSFQEFEDFLTTAPRLLQPVLVHMDILNLNEPHAIRLFILWLLEGDPSTRIQIDTLRLGPLYNDSWLTNPSIQRLLASRNTTADHLQIETSEFAYEEQSKIGV